MSNIGDLSPKRVVFDISFGWYGEELRVNPKFSPLDLIDFMDAAQNVDENDPSSITLVKKLFVSLVHPDDFAAFWQSARDNGLGVEDLMETYQTVASKRAGRPFGPASESSDGPLPTALASGAGSRSQGIEVPSDLAEKAVRLAPGRPDKQAMIVHYHED